MVINKRAVLIDTIGRNKYIARGYEFMMIDSDVQDGHADIRSLLDV